MNQVNTNRRTGRTTEALCRASDWVLRNPDKTALYVVHNAVMLDYAKRLIAAHGLCERVRVVLLSGVVKASRGATGAYWFDHALGSSSVRDNARERWDASDALRDNPRWIFGEDAAKGLGPH